MALLKVRLQQEAKLAQSLALESLALSVRAKRWTPPVLWDFGTLQSCQTFGSNPRWTTGVALRPTVILHSIQRMIKDRTSDCQEDR